jgi:hypothetical protein
MHDAGSARNLLGAHTGPPFLEIYVNVVALQDNGKRLNRVDGGQRECFAGAQRKASAVQRANDRFPIDFTFREPRPFVGTDIADGKIGILHPENCDGRLVKPFHASRSEFRSRTESLQTHAKKKSQNRTNSTKEKLPDGLRMVPTKPLLSGINQHTKSGELSSIAGNDKARTRQAKIERPATGYGSILSAISNLPSLMVTTNPGFDAFRWASNEIRPVTPSKSAVFANASRIAIVSIVPAR